MFVALATPVVAQTAADVSAAADINASIDARGNAQPLELIKAKAKQIQQNVQGGIDVRANVNANANARLENGSSTAPRGLQAIVRLRGGEIRNRFRLAINHMNNILTRIDSRLEKMRAAGVDVGAVATLKVDAELALDTAEADVQAITDYMASVNDSSDRAHVRAELAAKIKTAHDSLKAAHAALLKVVRALVKLAVDNKAKLKVDTSVSATTTVQ